MLYQAYQFHDDVVAPFRSWARNWMAMLGSGISGPQDSMTRRYLAALELISRYQLTHVRPDFDINTVLSGNADVKVTPTVELMYCR